MGDGSPPDESSPSDENSPSDGASPLDEEAQSDEASPSGETPPGEEESPTDGTPPAEEGDPPEEANPSGGDGGAVGLLREVAIGLAIAAVLAALLFGLSGVWPPMVAVESESMEPNLYRGDLVFVVEEHRLDSPAAVEETGVVPSRVGERVGHETFGGTGDVIVYHPDGRDRSTPIIHRAEFWVNESEDWYGKANPEYVSGEDCEAVPNCPAPHAGFVTRGDNNGRYDQVEGISEPVRPSWIRGTAEVKVPYLGRVRLAFG